MSTRPYAERYSKLRFSLIALCGVFCVFVFYSPGSSASKAGVMFLWVTAWLAFNIQLALVIRSIRGSVILWLLPSLPATLLVPPFALIPFFLARKKLHGGYVPHG